MQTFESTSGPSSSSGRFNDLLSASVSVFPLITSFLQDFGNYFTSLNPILLLFQMSDPESILPCLHGIRIKLY